LKKLFDYKELSHYPRMIQCIVFFHIVTIFKKFYREMVVFVALVMVQKHKKQS